MMISSEVTVISSRIMITITIFVEAIRKGQFSAALSLASALLTAGGRGGVAVGVRLVSPMVLICLSFCSTLQLSFCSITWA